MNKKEAVDLVAATVENFPGAEKFFVTTDKKIFVKAALAVAHACTLDAGNPTVQEVEASELPKAPPPVLTAEEALEIERERQRVEGEKKVAFIQSQIADHKNEDEIDEDNLEEKILVAGLNKQLKEAEAELAKFD